MFPFNKMFPVAFLTPFWLFDNLCYGRVFNPFLEAFCNTLEELGLMLGMPGTKHTNFGFIHSWEMHLTASSKTGTGGAGTGTRHLHNIKEKKR